MATRPPLRREIGVPRDDVLLVGERAPDSALETLTNDVGVPNDRPIVEQKSRWCALRGRSSDTTE